MYGENGHSQPDRTSHALSERAEPRFLALRRALFAAATALLSINLWTGSPLIALWVGSKAAGESALSMASLFVVALTLAALTFAISAALLWLEERYRVLVGLPGREGRLTWLRPFNAPRKSLTVQRSLLEHIVTAVVYLAVILFLVWFFFFAGSSLPHP